MGFKMTITTSGDNTSGQGKQPQPQPSKPDTDRPDGTTSRQPLDTV